MTWTTRDVMPWHLSWRADPRARMLADRHYNRQNPDSPQFVPPGRCLVLIAKSGFHPRGEHDALWITSYPQAEYVHHAWAGAWMCTAFRNESSRGGAGGFLSSDLIRAPVACTRAELGLPPPEGFVTFVDPGKTRRKRDPGRCYLRAGWKHVPCARCGGSGAISVPVDPTPLADRTLVGWEIACPDCGGDGRARTKTERLIVLRLDAADVGEPVAPQGTQMHLWRAS